MKVGEILKPKKSCGIKVGHPKTKMSGEVNVGNFQKKVTMKINGRENLLHKHMLR